MKKKDRCKNENVFVSSFVPEKHLPNKQPASLDPYLEPLLHELEDLFINGIICFEVLFLHFEIVLNGFIINACACKFESTIYKVDVNVF